MRRQVKYLFLLAGLLVVGSQAYAYTILTNVRAQQDTIVRNVTNVQRDVTNVTRVVSRSLCPVREGEKKLIAGRRCVDILYRAQTRAQRERMRGPRGRTGPQGRTGRTGRTGARGPRGFTGARGVQGPRGFAGPIGKVGPGGPAGIPGPAGQGGPPAVTPPITPPGQGGTPPGLTQQPNGNGPGNGKRKGGKP